MSQSLIGRLPSTPPQTSSWCFENIQNVGSHSQNMCRILLGDPSVEAPSTFSSCCMQCTAPACLNVFPISPGVVLVQMGWRCRHSHRDMLAAIHVCIRCSLERQKSCTMDERFALFHIRVLSSERDASDFASRHFDLGSASLSP